jgi:hypothetical protein
MCVSAHAPVHGGCGEGGTDTEGPRRRERKGAHGATAQCLAARAREAEREKGHGGGNNWRRQVGPSGQRARERARERKLPLTGGSHLQAARACGLAGPSWAARLLFLFLFL